MITVAENRQTAKAPARRPTRRTTVASICTGVNRGPFTRQSTASFPAVRSPPRINNTYGYYLAPTLFTNVDSSLQIAQEEILGSVFTMFTNDAQRAH